MNMMGSIERKFGDLRLICLERNAHACLCAQRILLYDMRWNISNSFRVGVLSAALVDSKYSIDVRRNWRIDAQTVRSQFGLVLDIQAHAPAFSGVDFPGAFPRFV